MALLLVVSLTQVAAVAVVCLHVAGHVPVAVLQRTWPGGLRAPTAQRLCQVGLRGRSLAGYAMSQTRCVTLSLWSCCCNKISC